MESETFQTFLLNPHLSWSIWPTPRSPLASSRRTRPSSAAWLSTFPARGSPPLRTRSADIQGVPSGRTLVRLTWSLSVPPSCPVAQPLLPISHPVHICWIWQIVEHFKFMSIEPRCATRLDYPFIEEYMVRWKFSQIFPCVWVYNFSAICKIYLFSWNI